QAWWSPSGYLARNIEHYTGKSITEFEFDPNPFGYGDYELNIYAVNGFSWDNCPASEIFDRSLGEQKLRVTLARPIQFGLLNLDVPIKIHLDAPTESARDDLTPEGAK